jgi:RNA polymerase sigma-70 factor (ECF subfamily)
MSDEELMLAFQAGDRGAFDELFDRYRGPIWAFFRRRTRQPADAEELAQEAFLAVCQGRVRYEPRAAFRSYLFSIAFNLLQASRRRQAARGDESVVTDALPAGSSDPTSTIWVRDALASLDADDREIVMLREFDALAYADIATLLGIPLNTVRSRLFRARLALKARLTGESASFEVRA